MEKHVEEVVQEMREVTSQLCVIWEEIGFDEKMCSERKSQISHLLKNRLSEVLDGERKLRKMYIRRIEENGEKFYRLNKELEVGLPDPDDSFGLHELDGYLRRNIEILNEELKKRQEKLKELREMEKELCDCLEEDCSIINRKAIPSKDDLTDLERRIRTLVQEKDNRVKTFSRLKIALCQLLEELEQSTKTSFELTVLSGVEELFTLSCTNLQLLKKLVEKYERKIKENKEESLELQEKIQHMHNRLEIDPCERDAFFASINGHTPTVLVKLHDEWQRLEDLKRENLSRLINQQRRQLEVLWEQCYISEEDRQDFTPYLSRDYTEECLEVHDKEVQRLEVYYNEWREIFINISRRDKLWHKFIKLEENANDPNRLRNRGCTLLQEEKERKRVRNELPRVEKNLEDMVAAWEKQQGHPFLVEGKNVNDYIVDQWHKHHLQKEQEKEKKQSARKKQLQDNSQTGTKSQSETMKRRLPRSETRRAKLRRIGENSPGNLTSSQLQDDSRIGAKSHSVTMKRRLPRSEARRAKLRRIGKNSPGSLPSSTPVRERRGVLCEYNTYAVLPSLRHPQQSAQVNLSIFSLY